MAKCSHKGCQNIAVYAVEWHGYNQNGEAPLVVYENLSCGRIKHLLEAAANNSSLGEAPNCISDYDTPEMDYPKLFRRVLVEVYGEKRFPEVGVQAKLCDFIDSESSAEN